MRLGFHISIAGGFRNVGRRAAARQCETIQLFSRSPRAWKYKSLNLDDVVAFKNDMVERDIHPVFVHLPYLVNLATPNKELFERSVDALAEDLKRSTLIGASFLIMHVGSAAESNRGLSRIAEGINQVQGEIKNKVRLLLENTAGSGHELGHQFSQLQTLLEQINDHARIGIALDTAHAFAAGYDLRSRKAIDRTIVEFEHTIGLERLHLIHLNDSKAECGSRTDRHWHIGKGRIGKGMHHLLHHPALQHLPFIMETPRTNLKEDIMNMKRVRQILATSAAH